MGDPSEDSEIRFQLPAEYVKGLREMLRAFPALSLFSRGWFGTRTVTVSGPAAEIRAARARIEAWVQDALSRDAW